MFKNIFKKKKEVENKDIAYDPFPMNNSPLKFEAPMTELLNMDTVTFEQLSLEEREEIVMSHLFLIIDKENKIIDADPKYLKFYYISNIKPPCYTKLLFELFPINYNSYKFLGKALEVKFIASDIENKDHECTDQKYEYTIIINSCLCVLGGGYRRMTAATIHRKKQFVEEL